MPLQSPNHKERAFDIGKIRHELKVPYQKPSFYNTMYGDSFLDRKGSADVGSLTKEGMRAEKIRRPPKGEVEDFSSMPCKFFSSTSKQMQYPDY